MQKTRLDVNVEVIQEVKVQLENEGYFNDEQFYGSYTVEHSLDDITVQLASVGYNQKLDHRGDFFEGYGAVYWVFDPEVVSIEEANTITQKWVKSQMKQN